MARSERGAAWRRFTLVVPAEDAQRATALLETATSARAAVERSGVRCGRDGLVTPLSCITVHVARIDARRATKRVAAMIAAAKARRLLRYTDLATEDVRGEAWASSWKKWHKPIHIAPGLFIAPSWERTFKAPRGSKVLWLDPGMAFGTGHHASTQLAINLALSYVRRGAVALDIGCGSGILALAAAQRGARVYASDLDPIAVEATRINFAANKLKCVQVIRARGVPASFPKADLIVANITEQVLGPLAPALARKLKPGGILVASGFIKSSEGRIRRVLESQGLELLEEGRRAQLSFDRGTAVVTGLWRALVYKKCGRA